MERKLALQNVHLPGIHSVCVQTKDAENFYNKMQTWQILTKQGSSVSRRKI